MMGMTGSWARRQDISGFMKAINESFDFAVVGAGWRTDFFLRIAQAIPQMRVCGVVARNAERAGELSSEWDVPCFASIAELMRDTQPTYVIASVSAVAMPDICLELVDHDVPVLAETPPAPDLDRLISFYHQCLAGGARIQVGLVVQGLLGGIVYALRK